MRNLEDVILRTGVMKRLFLFCLVTYCVQFANAQFSGKGSGTKEDPYLVSTALNVWEIRNKPGGVFKLVNDIDMSKLIEDTDADAGWNPISNFYGELDGGGFAISGLFINRPTEKYVGFFGELVSAFKIHDLTLIYSGNIIGESVVGGLCGGCRTSVDSRYSSSILRCKVKAKTISGGDVGGLLGNLSGDGISNRNNIPTVEECVAEAVQIEGSNSGGLIGFGQMCNIQDNSVRVKTITGKYGACGVVGGGSTNIKIKNNIFEGNIIKSFENDLGSGGVFTYCGRDVSNSPTSSISSNVVICDSIIGRKIGRIGVYADERIDISTNANRAYSKIVLKKGEDCFFATDSKLNGMSVGDILLMSSNMYKGMGWDMDNVWTIDDGNSYPGLKWEVEKEMDKHKLIITNQGKEINDNDELTFLAEKVTTNLGGGISYTYYQCIPDEPIIENTSSRSQQVTVTITSEDFSHLKWAGINGQEADMKEATETRTCQLERSASVPLKLHAIFAEQDFGSYTANIQVSCDNFTRNFSIRFINENPNKPVCPTPFIDYADGKLTFSCDIEGTPEYHVNITDPDVNTFTVNGELQLERTYIVEAYATAEGYQPSETASLTLCWIDKEIVEYTDGLVKEEGFPIKIRTDNGAVSVSGVLPNTLVSAYSLDGILLDSTTSASGTVNLKIPANTDAVILKFGDNSIKVRIK